jgi:hypothetical protein
VTEYRVIGTGTNRRLSPGETTVILAGVQGPSGSVAGLEEIAIKVEEHEAKPDPHPQYATDDDLDAHVDDASAAHAASAIGVTPAGTIAATDVQAALAELDGDVVTVAGAVSAHVDDASAAHAASAIGVTPAGTIAATDVQAALVELDGDVTGHVGDASAAHAASAIANTPAGTIAATDVQAALNELDTDKQALSAKDAAGGYCGLDSNARIENARLGTGGAAAATQVLAADQTWKYASRIIRAGANVPAPAGSKNWLVFRAPVAMTIDAIYAIHEGGTSCNVNVRKNGSSTLRSSDYTTTTSWASFGTLQNNTLAAGDSLEVQIVSVSGSVNQVAVQIEGTPTA